MHANLATIAPMLGAVRTGHTGSANSYERSDRQNFGQRTGTKCEAASMRREIRALRRAERRNLVVDEILDVSDVELIAYEPARPDEAEEDLSWCDACEAPECSLEELGFTPAETFAEIATSAVLGDVFDPEECQWGFTVSDRPVGSHGGKARKSTANDAAARWLADHTA